MRATSGILFLVTLLTACGSAAPRDPVPTNTDSPTSPGERIPAPGISMPAEEPGEEGEPTPPTPPKPPACVDIDTSSLTYVPVVNEGGAPPALGGGTIFDGDYVLTASRSYVVIGSPEPPPPERRGALKIEAGGTLSIAVDPSPGTVHTVMAAYGTSGGELEMIPFCFVNENGSIPMTANEPLHVIAYSATPTTIIVRAGGSITVAVDGQGNMVVTAQSVEDYTFTR